jgi:arginase
VTNILVPYHLDEYLPELDVPLQPDVTISADLPDGDPWHRMAGLYDRAAETIAADVRAGRRPTVMSGDWTTSYATVVGMQRAGLDPSIVWFDGHGDVQTLETTTSGYIGGMPIRVLSGYRPRLIADSLGLRPVPEDRITLVDARDLDPPEVTYLAEAPIRHVDVDALTADVLPDGPLYLHVDFDVVNADELPGLLFPAPGGPSLDSVSAAIDRVLATGRVAALGLACTWHPGHDAADRVAATLPLR